MKHGKGTTFGALHSLRDLELIQQLVEVEPAAPKTNFVDVPGANGSKDLTEALGVGVKYNDRTITWTFALYPGADWYAAQARVSNALNGRRFEITLDDDPAWCYIGRVSVTAHSSDKLLKQITVSALCEPYKRRKHNTQITQALSAEWVEIPLHIGELPQIPQLTASEGTVVRWYGTEIPLSEGVNKPLALLMSGRQVLEAKNVDGTGALEAIWREGSL